MESFLSPLLRPGSSSLALVPDACSACVATSGRGELLQPSFERGLTRRWRVEHLILPRLLCSPAHQRAPDAFPSSDEQSAHATQPQRASESAHRGETGRDQTD